jgi:hypothetical protein
MIMSIGSRVVRHNTEILKFSFWNESENEVLRTGNLSYMTSQVYAIFKIQTATMNCNLIVILDNKESWNDGIFTP